MPIPDPLAIPHGEWMAPGQAARALEVSSQTLKSWTTKGLLAAVVTPGGQRRYRASDVQALLRPATLGEPADTEPAPPAPPAPPPTATCSGHWPIT